MKTIDFLVQELPKLGGWPDGAIGAGFLCGEGTLYFWDESEDCPAKWRIDTEAEVEDVESEISREQYEASLADKNDGWIVWGGGECPVDAGKMVDVIFGYGGRRSTNIADCWRWNHNGTDSDIIAYRLHQPKEVAQTEAEQEADLNERIGQAPETEWNGEGLPPVGCECEYSLNGGSTWWKCKIDYIVGTQGVVMLCDTFEGVQYVHFSSYGNALKFRHTRSEAERKREEAVKTIMLTGWCQSAAEEIYDLVAAGRVPGMKLED